MGAVPPMSTPLAVPAPGTTTWAGVFRPDAAT